jgi:hypothetical protein
VDQGEEMLGESMGRRRKESAKKGEQDGSNVSGNGRVLVKHQRREETSTQAYVGVGNELEEVNWLLEFAQLAQVRC